MHLGPLKDRVVVELGIDGPSEILPVGDQRVGNESGHYRVRHRPGCSQSAVQGDSVENLDMWAALDDQTLDDVEAVQFRASGGDVWQIPTWRGRGSSGAASSIEGATPLENAVDGPHRRQGADTAMNHLLVDGLGPVEAQVAVLAELAPQVEDRSLDLRSGPLGRAGEGRPITTR